MKEATIPTFHELALRVDTAGIASVEADIESLVIEARRRGAPATIVDVLADSGQSDVARQRALARTRAWMQTPAVLPLDLRLAC